MAREMYRRCFPPFVKGECHKESYICGANLGKLRLFFRNFVARLRLCGVE